MARRIVAGGPTADDQAAGKDDPELRALREAERILFPEPLVGAQPGWTWDVPAPVVAPPSDTSGLPPTAFVQPEHGPQEPSAEDAEWLRSLTMPNLPVRLDARVVKYLKFYRDTPRGRAIGRAWAKKSGRYVPTLKAELAKAGLPTDLVWLSLIESGHNPTIKSPAGAAGLWQFIPESGRMYGLTVDRWVDERLEPARATTAAIRFLSDLHRRFGSWELAMASYNMGYGGMSRAIRKFNTNDFWELCRYEAGIPWETTLYVPKIMAIAIVMNNKRAFGLQDIDPDPPASFDTVLVEPGSSLQQVARAAQVPLEAIEALNGHYLAGRTPPLAPGAKPRKWPVRVPKGEGPDASAKLVKQGATAEGVRPYRVRFGDTLDSVASDLGVSAATLRRVNQISGDEPLERGMVILVPRDTEARPQPERQLVVVPPRSFHYPQRQRVFYEVRSRDTLQRIADAFGVHRSDVVAWNTLDESATLQGGMMLQLFVRPQHSLRDVRHLEESDVRMLVAGTPEFYDYFEGLKGKRRVLVAVKQGETLRSIGKRFGMSVGWMERVNRRSRRDDLEPGEKLVVYTSPAMAELAGAASASTAGPDPDPLESVDAPLPEVLPGSQPAASPVAMPAQATE